MSNQAHKNRTSVKHGVTVYKPERTNVIRQRLKRQAEGMARRAELSPKTNPAGKAKYEAISGTFGEPYFQTEIKEIKPMMDPSSHSRGANVRANKERGTQSSAQRKVIK